jgi:hypothetical protein
MIIGELTWPQFKTLDSIRNLDESKQVQHYYEYLTWLGNQHNHQNKGPLLNQDPPILSCLSSMEFIVQYNETLGSCPGGHFCDAATFYLRANTTTVGTVYLSNTNGPNDQHNYPPGETSGYNRYNTLALTPEQIQEITATSENGNISLALICATPPDQDYGWGLGHCHANVTWITLKLNGTEIYSGCPNNNFLTINPCTGEIS